MAMANVARWFQLQGLNVAVVDWDLEAPGLESFYAADQATLAAWRGRLGLMDLLTLYRQDFPNLGLSDASMEDAAALRADVDRLHEALAPLRFLLLDIPPPVEPPLSDAPPSVPPGKLSLLSAGWREGAERFARYANAVQAFDWSDFYARCRGQAYFEWMREQLCQPDVADIVLVDSRTGVTEMGGVCTRQLADVVAVLSAPNRQNIEGAARMARAFTELSGLSWRGGRPLEVVMVPSRIDSSSRLVKAVFEPMFRSHVEGLMPERLQLLQRDFWNLRIPYVDAYAFEERLAVGEASADTDLVGAYRELAAHVAWLAPTSSRIHQAMRAEFERVFGAEQVRGLLDVTAQFDAAWRQVPQEQQAAMRDLLLRLVQVGETPDDGDRLRNLRRSELDGALDPIVLQALRAGLVKSERGSDGGERLALVDAEVIRRTPVADWVREDRQTLLWRQRLRTYLEDWQRKGNEPAALLQGSLLTEAEHQANIGVPLLTDEREFIGRSRAWDDQQRAIEEGRAAELARSAELARAAESTLASAAPGPASGMQTMTTAQAGSTAAPPPKRSGTWAVLLSLVVLALAGTGWALFANKSPAGGYPSAASAAGTNGTEALLRDVRALVDAGKSAEAQAKLDAALAGAPRTPEWLLSRAKLKGDARDSAGALADLYAAEAAGAALDAEALTLRGRMYFAQGDNDKAGAAFQSALMLSDTSAARLGLAQVQERLGNRDMALQFYLSAKASSTDSREIALAEARIQALQAYGSTSTTQATATTAQAVLQISLAADAPLAQALGQALEKVGVRLASGKQGYAWEVVPQSRATSEVRYFYAEDQDAGRRAQVAAQNALAAAGIDLKLGLKFVDPKKLGLKAQSGMVELWLPPVATLRGQRVQVFACGAAPQTTSIADAIEKELRNQGAQLQARVAVSEADRKQRFGLPPKGLEIRHAQSLLPELLAARLLQDTPAVQSLGTWRLVALRTTTPGYISVFVCP